MKFTFCKALLCLSLVFLFFSCEKEVDETETISSAKTSKRTTDRTTDRTSSDDPFFDLMYTHDTLDVGSSDEYGYYTFVSNYMIDLSSQVTKGSFFDELKNQSIYPCWYCGESEYIDFENYYVPFYDLEDSRLDGILIIQEKEGLKTSYYLSHALVKQLARERVEAYSQYWSRIMNYFDGGVTGKSKKKYFNSRTEVCKKNFVSCKCNISFTLCTEDIAPNGTYDCSGTCSGDTEGDTGGDTGGDTNNEDGGPLTIANVNTWINNTDNDSGGGGSTITPTTPSWDEFCGGFNGSLAVSGGDVINTNNDGTINIALVDAAVLYENQLSNFINNYGLQSQFTPKELAEFIGEECAVSNVNDVNDCLKCHFISSLGLPDDVNWDLKNNNFEIVTNCIGDPDLNCVECAISIKAFKKKYELLELSPEEEEAIILLVNSSNCGTDGYNLEALKVIVNIRTNYTQTDEDISFLASFLSTSDNKKELIEYYKTIVQLRMNDPLIRWDRSTELFYLFNIDYDNILISACGDVSPWADLASFVIPSEVNNRVTSLGWTNQDIEMGNTKQVNLDYHSVSITTLPDINGDGVATEEELFSEIRLNFPAYADGNISVEVSGPDINASATWSFYSNDFESYWNTDNGLKTIVEIDTEANPEEWYTGITDDASVICSSFENNCCWVFSTVWANQIGNSNNGSHPVSGNRQFGLKQLKDGTYEFYIRAADRARINWFVNGLSNLFGNNSTEVFYAITDASWDNLTTNIVELINYEDYGGEASKNKPIIQRPDWEAVKEELKSGSPLSILPCKY